MNVRELIELLKTMPQDAAVSLLVDDSVTFIESVTYDDDSETVDIRG